MTDRIYLRSHQLLATMTASLLLTSLHASAQDRLEPVADDGTPPSAAVAPTSPPLASAPAEVIQIAPAPHPTASEAVSEPLCPPPDGTRPDPTLVNTDAFVLQRFPLSRVYGQLLQLGHTSNQSATALYQQMWDTMDTAHAAKFHAPHCDDATPPSLNGFPLECPRPETVLKDSSPSTFVPVALFNRFDLAPSDGQNCGEYRIIYAMAPFDEANRNFMIFEGVLPNPNPSCGIEACRPVAEYWKNLASLNPATQAGRSALADRLERFYFDGIPGFKPVIHPNHYGMSGRGGYGGANGGQIRTNMFVTGKTWQLREFRIARRCRLSGCRLVLEPASVKSNPFPALFNENHAPAHERAASFLEAFPKLTSHLISDEVNMISLPIDDQFNAAQSTPSDPNNDDYVTQAVLGITNGSSRLTSSVQAELDRLGVTNISSLDVVQRAMTQSCAGCHLLARGFALSGDGTAGPVWPKPRPEGFVHVDEHGFLSEGLWCSFLPFRKSVLDGFLASAPHSCMAAHPPTTIVSSSATAAPSGTSSVPTTVCGKPFGPN